MMVSDMNPRSAALEWARAHTIEHSGTVYTVHVEPWPNPRRKLVHRFEVHGCRVRVDNVFDVRYFAEEIKPVRNHPEWNPEPPSCASSPS
jgi:hypothetical protein